MTLPILFLGDSPDLPSGLGRITRSIASRLSSHPDFRVGVLGLGGVGSVGLPFQAYTIQGSSWGQNCFESVVKDFFGGQRPGVVMPIWDLGRIGWLPAAVRKEGLALWGYHPIDGEGPGGVLHPIHAETVRGHQRVAAYSEFAARLLRGAAANVRVLSHGVESGVFYPRSKLSALLPFVNGKKKLVGCVATNQARKDYGALFEAFSLLGEDCVFWVHTDRLRNVEGWSLPELASAFGLVPGWNLFFTTEATDGEMAELYSMCDVVVDPAAEGWGYPQAEARMCGVDSIGVGYAAGCEVASRVVAPETFYWRDIVKRPVLRAETVAEEIEGVLDAPRRKGVVRLEAMEKFSWDVVWGEWVNWFEEGLR